MSRKNNNNNPISSTDSSADGNLDITTDEKTSNSFSATVDENKMAVTAKESTKQTTVTFSDSKQVTKVSLDTTRVTNYASLADSSISSFFSRPVKIDTITWTVGAGIGKVFNPWQAWATNPAVQSKLKFYELMRCDLNLIFQVNGSPFHFGRALIAYEPFAGFEKGDGFSDLEGIKMKYSQRSPTVYIDPCMQDSVSMKLPYFYPTDYYLVKDTPSMDLGILHYVDYAFLDAASTSASPNITITVFAYASNMELTIPVPTDFTVQMDEYNPEGVISKPANVVAQVASTLEGVPIIGPFAKATNIGASAISNIASLFGFSKPVDIRPATLMKRDIVSNSANTTGLAPINKLTFDPKQEVAIGPKSVGLDSSHDCMTIAHVAGRKSYVMTSTWSEAQTPDTVLGTIQVTPTYAVTQSTAGYDRIQMTALAFATLPFCYWGGSIIYTISIVASQYHRGRLKVTWLPADILPTPANLASYNTNYSAILDLDENREVDLTVSMVANVPYLFIGDPTTTTFDNTGILAGPNPDFDNGSLYISIVNELTSPDTNSPVSVIVSARGGPDFRVFGIKDQGSEQLSVRQLASKFAVINGLTVPPPTTLFANFLFSNLDFNFQMDNADAITNQSLIKNIDIVSPANNVNYESLDNRHHADPIVSFRNVLKRWNFVENQSYAKNTALGSNPAFGHVRFKVYRNNMPPMTGAPLIGVDAYNREGGSYANFTGNPLISYLKGGYIAWRGGIRYRYMNTDMRVFGQSSTQPGMMFVTRSSTQPDSNPADWVLNDDFDSNSAGFFPAKGYLNSTVPTMYEGSHYTTANQQSAVEVELPYYNNKSFCLTEPNTLRGSSLDGSCNQMHCLDYLTTTYEGSFAALNYASFISTADDFSFFWFIGAPTYAIIPQS